MKELIEKLKPAMTQVWQKVLDLLPELEPGISFEALAVFAIYFSQLDDGNICIPLDPEKLTEKWQKKWEGILLQEGESPCQTPPPLRPVPPPLHGTRSKPFCPSPIM